MTCRTDASRASKSGPVGTSNGTRASASVRLARTMRWAIVASGTRKARAISSVRRPPSRQGQRDARIHRQDGVAADEDQPQEVVSDRRVVDRRVLVVRCGLLELHRAAQLRLLALEGHGPGDMVDGTSLGDGHEPGA